MTLTTPAAPSFQQVLPPEQWFPPSRTTSDVPHGDTFKNTKSQKYWLLKTHPEAFLGHVNLQGIISEEIRASRSHDGGVESQLGSVLAVGEISDLRNPSHPVSWPAVAMAAGEAGHVLRVSMISLEKWTWAESSFPIGATQSQFFGTWSSDGCPISKIQFATKQRQYDPIRWLIAQRPMSTTIFQPEIRAKRTAGVVQTAMLGDADLQHIALVPIVTLTKDATGGEDHSDFTVNVGSETDAPQIAIVDSFGNWSVWFVDSQRNQHGTPTIYTAVPKSRGTCGLSPSPWPSNQPHPSENHYRISWVFRSAGVDDWERDSSSSEEPPGSASRSLQTDYLTGRVESAPKYDGLLICDSTRVQILDTEGSNAHSYLNFSRRHSRDVVLDAQYIEGCPTHALVLTTEKLYVLDISSVGDQEARKPSILVSCPHFRGQTKQALQMSLARFQSSAEYSSSLVFVYSSHSSRVQLFRLAIASKDGSASFHHQVVQIPGFPNSLGGLGGIASLHAVPLRRSSSHGSHRSGSETTGAHIDAYELQLFQLFGLTNDLSLASSVIAITSGDAQWPGRPEGPAKTVWDDKKWRASLRKKVLREVENAVVVPDVVEENKQLSRQRLTRSSSRHDISQLRSYLIQLMNEIMAGFENRSLVSSGDNSVGPFDSVTGVSEKREPHEHIALQPLLRFKDWWHALDLVMMEGLWNRDIERLKKSSGYHLFQCGTFAPTLDVTDFFERFSIDWTSRLADESLEETQWRYVQLALERMAAEVYLSEKGIYMVPQSTLDLASRAAPKEGNSQSTVDGLYRELPLSRAGSETTLPTPSATPSSSRATSQVAESFETQEEDDAPERKDAAVTRLRIYLPSISLTPPANQVQSRLLSLWPEERGRDPENYRYSRKGKGPDGLEQGLSRRREKEEERRRRRAERRVQIGITLEDFGGSSSQTHVPDEARSSPPPQLFAKSQGQHLGFGFGSQSQAQSQSQGFGPFQTMSQPLRGEFGTRAPVLRRKVKGKPKAKSGFK